MGAAASLVTVPLSMMSGCSSALTGCCATMGGACLANMTCKACTCACVVPKKLASIIYASTLMFFVVFAYIMRYNGGDWVIGGGYNVTEASYMEQMQHLAKKGTGVLDDWNGRFWCAPRHPDAWVICCEDVCGGVFAVYRVSFALCLFFAFLALCTCGTTVFGAKAHRGFWFAKIFLLLGLVISTFFIDNHAMEGYRETARYLSWAFLMLQILLLIDFGYNWNETWLAYDEASDYEQFWGSWRSGIVGVAATMYLGSLGAWIFMYHAFGSEGCPAQQTIISITLILTLILSIISCTKIAPHGTLLTSSVVTSYCTYLCYSALASHPSHTCNPFHTDQAHVWRDQVVGLLVACISVCTIVSSTTGSKTAIIGRETGSEMTAKLDDSGVPSSINGSSSDSTDDHVGPESWWYYHLMMVACSMYIAMLITDWSEQPAFDHGVPATKEAANAYNTSLQSFWVKAVSQWMCLLLYAWTLLAPYCLRHYRDFGIEFDD